MKPVRYMKRFDSKTQNAHLILFDDGKKYVVKMHKKSAKRILVNEWLGYHLARYMNLPVPLTTFVELPEEFINQTPELSSDVLMTEKQLATTYIENTKNAHELNVNNIVNKEQLAGIIVLDYWMANIDRTRKNVLFTEADKDSYYLWAIDYGDSFGSFSWQKEDLKTLPKSVMKSATHELLASFVASEDEFRQQLAIINAIPILLFEEVLSLVPPDWELTKEEKHKIIKTMIHRRDKKMSNLIEKFVTNVYRPLHEKDS